MNNFLMFLIKICQYENLNSMPSEARQNFLKKFCVIYVKEGVIWASEYSLGPQK